jgi:hypothetical protein
MSQRIRNLSLVIFASLALGVAGGVAAESASQSQPSSPAIATALQQVDARQHQMLANEARDSRQLTSDSHELSSIQDELRAMCEEMLRLPPPTSGTPLATVFVKCGQIVGSP